MGPGNGPQYGDQYEQYRTVAMVLPSSAMPSFPADSLAAMIPEPITQAKRKNDPTASAATRRPNGG